MAKAFHGALRICLAALPGALKSGGSTLLREMAMRERDEVFTPGQFWLYGFSWAHLLPTGKFLLV